LFLVEYLVNLTGFNNFWLQREIIQLGRCQVPIDSSLRIPQQGPDARAEIRVVKESILLVAYVNESCIEARHETMNLTNKHITHGEVAIGLLVVKLYELTIFQQSDFDL